MQEQLLHSVVGPSWPGSAKQEEESEHADCHSWLGRSAGNKIGFRKQDATRDGPGMDIMIIFLFSLKNVLKRKILMNEKEEANIFFFASKFSQRDIFHNQPTSKKGTVKGIQNYQTSIYN